MRSWTSSAPVAARRGEGAGAPSRSVSASTADAKERPAGGVPPSPPTLRQRRRQLDEEEEEEEEELPPPSGAGASAALLSSTNADSAAVAGYEVIRTGVGYVAVGPDGGRWRIKRDPASQRTFFVSEATAQKLWRLPSVAAVGSGGKASRSSRSDGDAAHPRSPARPPLSPLRICDESGSGAEVPPPPLRREPATTVLSSNLWGSTPPDALKEEEEEEGPQQRSLSLRPAAGGGGSAHSLCPPLPLEDPALFASALDASVFDAVACLERVDARRREIERSEVRLTQAMPPSTRSSGGSGSAPGQQRQQRQQQRSPVGRPIAARSLRSSGGGAVGAPEAGLGAKPQHATVGGAHPCSAPVPFERILSIMRAGSGSDDGSGTDSAAPAPLPRASAARPSAAPAKQQPRSTSAARKAAPTPTSTTGTAMRTRRASSLGPGSRRASERKGVSEGAADSAANAPPQPRRRHHWEAYAEQLHDAASRRTQRAVRSDDKSSLLRRVERATAAMDGAEPGADEVVSLLETLRDERESARRVEAALRQREAQLTSEVRRLEAAVAQRHHQQEEDGSPRAPAPIAESRRTPTADCPSSTRGEAAADAATGRRSSSPASPPTNLERLSAMMLAAVVAAQRGGESPAAQADTAVLSTEQSTAQPKTPESGEAADGTRKGGGSLSATDASHRSAGRGSDRWAALLRDVAGNGEQRRCGSQLDSFELSGAQQQQQQQPPHPTQRTAAGSMRLVRNELLAAAAAEAHRPSKADAPAGEQEVQLELHHVEEDYALVDYKKLAALEENMLAWSRWCVCMEGVA